MNPLIRSLNKRLFLVLLLCCTGRTLLFSQKKNPAKLDYMVYESGDTIYGKFKKPLFGTLVFVSEGQSIVPDPQYFKAYYSKSEKKIYRKVIIDKKPYWFALIEDGIIKLYEQIDNNYLANGQSTVIRRWVGQKNNGPLQQIKSSGPEGLNDNGRLNLEFYVSDDKDIYQRVHEATSYSFKNVRDAIQEYNNKYSFPQ